MKRVSRGHECNTCAIQTFNDCGGQYYQRRDSSAGSRVVGSVHQPLADSEAGITVQLPGVRVIGNTVEVFGQAVWQTGSWYKKYPWELTTRRDHTFRHAFVTLSFPLFRLHCTFTAMASNFFTSKAPSTKSFATTKQTLEPALQPWVEK